MLLMENHKVLLIIENKDHLYWNVDEKDTGIDINTYAISTWFMIAWHPGSFVERCRALRRTLKSSVDGASSQQSQSANTSISGNLLPSLRKMNFSFDNSDQRKKSDVLVLSLYCCNFSTPESQRSVRRSPYSPSLIDRTWHCERWMCYKIR